MMKRIALLALFAICSMFPTTIWAQQEATSIEIDPIADVNPVKTQHTFTVTVKDQSGRPMANQPVEWILSRGPQMVGDIVEHHGEGSVQGGATVDKLDNHYSISYTSEKEGVAPNGSKINPGQTWCTITSPVEGETHVIAFCPRIKNPNNHKVFAVKYWIDAKIDWPVNAINPIGEPHTFTFKLVKASDDKPLVGYKVRWELAPEGVPGYLGDNQENKVVETQTNEEGIATVTLKQLNKQPGTNRVQIELRNPEGRLLGKRDVIKTWIAPNLVIKKMGPAEGILNESITYVIEFSNNGAADAKDVELRDKLPEGLLYQSASVEPKEQKEGDTVWSIGELKRGETRSITQVTRGAKVGVWTTDVQIFSDLGPGPSSSVTTKIVAPELYLVKEGPAQVRKGEQARYKVTLKNQGGGVARDVVIRDDIPKGMKFQNRTEGFTIKWNVGELAAGASRTFDYVLDTPETGKFLNTAKVYIKDKPVHTAEVTTLVVAPDLKLTKEAKERIIFVQKIARFEIVVKNEGNGSATNVTLIDTFPIQMEYITSEPEGSLKPPRGEDPATVTWRLGEIKPGQEIRIALELRAKQIPPSQICINTVKLTHNEGPVMEAKAQVRVTGVAAMHLSTYDTDDPVEVGQNTIYFIEARNEGTDPCTNVKMTCEIPEEMEYVSHSSTPAVEATIEGRKITFKPVAILQPTQKAVYKITCRALQQGSAKHRAILHYDQFEKDIMDEEGTSTYK